jgi:hypothetical protein
MPSYAQICWNLESLFKHTNLGLVSSKAPLPKPEYYLQYGPEPTSSLSALRLWMKSNPARDNRRIHPALAGIQLPQTFAPRTAPNFAMSSSLRTSASTIPALSSPLKFHTTVLLDDRSDFLSNGFGVRWITTVVLQSAHEASGGSACSATSAPHTRFLDGLEAPSWSAGDMEAFWGAVDGFFDADDA